MSRLYGDVKGAAKTAATRRGHKEISSHVRGWNLGVEIKGRAKGDDDQFEIYITSGSNNASKPRLFATVTSSGVILA